ncbi:MAG: hypothetical protein MKZ95_13705, partial [Pirellulales bacterium]|nr:hypothetical protein [Pirellulales bacterium]
MSVLDFSPATRTSQIEQLTRPSLSYWQDAWIRLRKNIRAIISLYIIILLGLFTTVGPVIWQIDPALQDINQISQPPSLPKTALLVAPYERWDGVVIDDFPAQASEYLETVDTPTGLRVFDDPTTQRVRLIWDPVHGGSGYNIYRNQRYPEDFNDLGLPLGGTFAGNKVSYEDRLSLESRSYYY